MKRFALLASLLALSGTALADSTQDFGILSQSQSTQATLAATPFSTTPAHVTFYRIQLEQNNTVVADSTIGVSDGTTGVYSVTKNTAYTKAISNTISANGKEKVVVEPGTVESGFTIKLHQFAENTVRIQATVRNLVALRRQQANPDDTSADAPFIELPDVHVNDMLNSFKLAEGQSIELTGVQSVDGTHSIPSLRVKVTHLKDQNAQVPSVAAL